MSDTTIRLVDQRYLARPMPQAPMAGASPGPTRDALGRALRDVRLSVTDRCNFRCGYCMPKSVFDHHYAFLPQAALLSFEEITRLARVFLHLGTEKIRLTGGEPLLRKNLEVLVEMLAALRNPKGHPPELALTSNGALLRRKAQLLRSAGLDRITVSLDAIDDAIFRKMNDVDFPVEQVLDGIRAAEEAGFRSLKINMVVQRGLNESQILPMVENFRHRGHVLRFIEFMDVGSSNGWNLDAVLPRAGILRQIASAHRLHPLEPQYAGEVAERWMLDDGSLEIGLISSVTSPFCAGCTRARVSTEGRLYTCLFASEGWDLRALLRTGASDEAISESLRQVWAQRSDRYSELRSFATRKARAERRIEMSYIGG